MDYAINPYLGCSHACVYCYARFMTRFDHAGEEWGTFVDAKVNAVEILRSELARKRKGKVLLSSVTDPYQPIEAHYKLTRGALEELLTRQYPVDILTKSDLVLRDIDLITKFDDVEVGFTITTLNDNVRKAFEPGASSVKSRLNALKKFSEEGVRTYAFLGPMLPYISDENLEEMVKILGGIVGRILIDRLNIKCGNMPIIKGALTMYYPDLTNIFEASLKPESNYYMALKRRIMSLCREHQLPADVIF